MRWVIYIVMLSVSSPVLAQSKSLEAKNWLNGKVKSVHTTMHYPKNKDEPRRKIEEEYITFNPQGYQTETWKKRFVPNPQQPRLSFHIKYEYGVDGTKRITRRRYKKDSTLKYVTTYTYDEKTGKVKQELVKKSNGLIRYVYNYTYDDSGNLLEKESWEGTTLTSTSNYTHDAKGNCTRIQVKGQYGGRDMSSLHLYKYDDKGNRIESRNTSAFGPGSIDRYKFKEDKIVEHSTYTIDGKLKSSHKFVYNEQGSLITKIDESNNIKRTTGRHYKYDEQGNWVQFIEFFNGKASKIAKREIMYYP